MDAHSTQGGHRPEGPDLGAIIRRHGDDLLRGRGLTVRQEKALQDIAVCRTAALGGHVDRCLDCDHEVITYNSCGNRHCPKCQMAAQERWIAKRLERVLDTHYFHLVFTLPSEVRGLAMANPRSIYNLMFRSVADTLLELGRDPKYLGAELGLTSVLHTWNKELQYHPHLHTIATGGGLALDGQSWVKARPQYLFPERVMADLFRGKFLAGLFRLRTEGELRFEGPAADWAHPVAFEALIDQLRQKRWVVYAKRPFAGPAQVLQYLGRYTHRVAIANSRLLDVTDDRITFRTKGTATTTLAIEEFLRRFLRHVLPYRLHKIRHYGIQAAAAVNTKWKRAKELAGQPPKAHDNKTRPEPPIFHCPNCGSTCIIRVELPLLPGQRSGPIKARPPPNVSLAS